MYYAPVRRSSARIATPVTARLACVRHAASVQSEPGSNSSLKDLQNFKSKSIHKAHRWTFYSPFLDFLVTRLMSPKESSTRVPTQITCKFLDSTTAAEGRRRGRNYRPEPNSVNFVSNIYLTHRAWARRPSVREGAHYRERFRSVNAMSHSASEFS